ncbi:MAG: sigma-70 family RNA polymerase sigma factor [Wenzhouxiangella sp.]|nr:MAG: sigma-70 family RNA polymerase sigma factor [Wenzhouxiangella sp.]
MSLDDETAVCEHEVTRLLNEIRGSPEQFDRLMPLLYDDMKRIGRAQRRRLGGNPTLQTTALVHEAFLKLRRNTDGEIENRLHFQRLAARVMRQLILDYARQQLAVKRGGHQVRVTWAEGEHAVEETDLVRVLAIEQALVDMAQHDTRMAEAMAAHLYADLTVEEIGKLHGVSSRTIVRDLRKARAWLRFELRDFKPRDSG